MQYQEKFKLLYATMWCELCYHAPEATVVVVGSIGVTVSCGVWCELHQAGDRGGGLPSCRCFAQLGMDVGWSVFVSDLLSDR